MKMTKIDFFHQNNASVSVEASIIFGLLILLIVLIGDIGKALINQSKMDRLSYALVSIIRERSLFDSQEVSPQDASNLYEILKNLKKDFISKDTDVSLKLEVMYFSTTSFNSPRPENILTYDFGDSACTLSNNLAGYANLSVQTSHKRYLPLYRVTTCIDQKSNFAPVEKLIAKIIKVQSSSIALGR